MHLNNLVQHIYMYLCPFPLSSHGHTEKLRPRRQHRGLNAGVQCTSREVLSLFPPGSGLPCDCSVSTCGGGDARTSEVGSRRCRSARLSGEVHLQDSQLPRKPHTAPRLPCCKEAQVHVLKKDHNYLHYKYLENVYVGYFNRHCFIN